MGLMSAALIAAAVSVWLTSPSIRRMTNVAGTPGPHSKRMRGRRKRRSHRQRSLSGQAPVVADLLATAIAAGATIGEAMVVVTEAVDEPIRSRLRTVVNAIDMGADHHSAWVEWLDEPALAPIAQAIIRSQHSGSPVSVVLDAAAADMRHSYRAEVEARARAAGVRVVAPLALCYLPAYLLVGVVPVVAGFANSLFG